MAWIELGWIGKSHGLDGSFLITGLDSDEVPYEKGTVVRLGSPDASDREHTVTRVQLLPKGWKIQLSGIPSPEDAKKLHRTPLFVDLEGVEAEEERTLYSSELQGFTAWDTENQTIAGIFEGVETLPAGPDRWWFIQGENSWSIPAVEKYILAVDHKDRRIDLAHARQFAEL